MIEPVYDFSSLVGEMEDSDPDLASELRDKRTNWDLRDRIQKLDHSKLLLCKLWALRDAECRSEKQQCMFCTRNVAVAEKAKDLGLSVVCLVCWLRAGRPFERELVQMADASA
jgi:hypothetical protein